jgi:enoyl-[acyl-carrier protein] reductase I
MGMLSGKRALIVGVASDRSIAWGIAQAMHAQGAQLAFSYANDTFKQRVEPLAATLGAKLTLPLDVQHDEQIDAAFALLEREWGHLDIVVHAVAFALRAKHCRAASQPIPRVRLFESPTTSRAIASPRWRAAVCR